MKKYQRLTIDEREQIVSFLSQGKSLRQIVLCLNRNVSTVLEKLVTSRKQVLPTRLVLLKIVRITFQPKGMLVQGLSIILNSIALLLRS
jgi:hypothetical protein